MNEAFDWVHGHVQSYMIMSCSCAAVSGNPDLAWLQAAAAAGHKEEHCSSWAQPCMDIQQTELAQGTV